MAYELAKVVSSFMDAKDWKHTLTGENQDVILTGLGGEKNIRGLELGIFFDPERNVHILSRDYVHVPDDKVDAMYKVVNELNRTYRWAKFSLDDEGDIVLEADAVLDLDTCGDEIMEILFRLTQIADEAYPVVMRGLYA